MCLFKKKPTIVTESQLLKHIKPNRVLTANDKRLRKMDWIGILIHHTGVNGRKSISEETWKRLNKNIANYLAAKDKYYVSAHYMIGRKGEITRIVDEDKFVAYHAGKSSFWHPVQRKWVTGCNDYFVGVELLGDGNSINYTSKQYLALADLSNTLMAKHPTIYPHCITGHEVVSPGRKTDPGVYFDWHEFFSLLLL